GGRDVRQYTLDTLRSASCAGGVLQQIPFGLVVDRCIRLICNTFRVTLPAVEVLVGDHQQRGQAVGQLLGQVLAGLAQRGGTDDGLGGAVVDDVRRLRRGQVRVDRHVVQPGP